MLPFITITTVTKITAAQPLEVLDNLRRPGPNILSSVEPIQGVGLQNQTNVEGGRSECAWEEGGCLEGQAGPTAEQVQPVPQGPRAGGLLGSAQQRERGTRHAVGVVLTHRVLEVEVLSVSGHWHARQEGQDIVVGLQDRRVRVAAPGPARERGPGPGSALCLPPKGLRTQRGVWFLALPRPGRFTNPRSPHISSCFPSTQSIHARGGSRPRARRKHSCETPARTGELQGGGDEASTEAGAQHWVGRGAAVIRW